MVSYKLLQELGKNCLELICYTGTYSFEENHDKSDESEENENSAVTAAGNFDNRVMQDSYKKLIGTYRKIVIASEMQERGIICISGLQGVGKTTMMKNYYDLPDSIFNIASERGEKIPIFITERENCQEYEMYAASLVKTGDAYEKHVEKIDAESFVKASKAAGDSGNIMYLELIVPYKYIMGNNYSFMLLPGFEEKDGSYWQNLIEFSVNCCDMAVFALQVDELSRKYNDEILKKVKKIFGENIIYAVTHSDVYSDNDEFELVKEACREALGLGENSDRIVYVGAYKKDKSKNEAWSNKLNKAIDAHRNKLETVREKSKEYIRRLIDRELKPTLKNIEACLDLAEGNKAHDKLKNDELLKAFDKTQKKYRKILDKELKKQLDDSAAKGKQKLEDSISNRTFIDNLGNLLFDKNSLKGLKKFRQSVENSLKENNNLTYQKACLTAFSNIADRINEDNELMKCILPKNDDIFRKAIEMKSSGNKNTDIVLARKNEITNEDKMLVLANEMNFYMQPSSSKLSEARLLLDPKITLNAISMAHVSYFISSVKNSIEEVCAGSLSTAERRKAEKKISEKSSSDLSKFFLGSFGFTAFDVLKDGSLDTIAVVAEGLGVAVPVAAGIVGSVIALGAAISVKRDINRLQFAELESGSYTIDLIHKNAREEIMLEFDESSEKLRSIIENNLIDANDIGRKNLDRINARFALKRIERLLDNIKKEVMKDEDFIGGAFGLKKG